MTKRRTKDKDLEAQIKALDRRLQGITLEIETAAECEARIEADPGNEDLKQESNARNLRLKHFFNALQYLPEDELELLYLHYEAGYSYRHLERFYKESNNPLHPNYSSKSLQLKNRTILERMILQNGSLLL